MSRPAPKLGNGVFVDLYTLPAVKRFAKPLVSYPNWSKLRIDWPFRLAVIGGTGTKKTQTFGNLLADIGIVDQCVVVATDLSDAVYQTMQAEPALFKVKEMLQTDQLAEWSALWAESDRETDDLVKLVCFDDVLGLRLPQSVTDVYSRGRRKGWSCVFINQSFFGTDGYVRANTRYIILKAVNQLKDAVSIFRQYGLPASLVSVYETIMQTPGDFMLLDTQAPDESLRVRRNYEPIANAMKLAAPTALPPAAKPKARQARPRKAKRLEDELDDLQLE